MGIPYHQRARKMLSTERIKEIADKILHAKLDPFGYAGVDVREGLNQEDEEALFLIGRMRKDAKIPPGRVTNETLAALADALLEEKEDRFPYFNLTFEGDEMPEIRPAPWED
jgi:hypothetical protein